MAELLLELFSEEIPAGMQARAAADLHTGVTKILSGAGLGFGAAQSFATPRRLTLILADVETAQADREIERRGPRVDAPEKARDGFLRGLGPVDYTLSEIEDKKGRFLLARFTQKGERTAELLARELPVLLASFPWPKSMRWSDGEARWVRPLRAILCRFDDAVVPFEFAGIPSGSMTYGHRFMAPEAIEVTDSAQYREALAAAHVILDSAERRRRIQAEVEKLAGDAGLSLIPDERLLAEVAGLVEFPVPYLGRIDEPFLALPPEVLQISMRVHQKYFALADAEGRLASRFAVVANTVTEDGGAAVVAGNERVLRARLWDAQFFWDLDRKTRLEDRLPELDAVVFHEKLGSIGDKARRMAALAGLLAQSAHGVDPAAAEQAARFAKCDLVTGMVGEFPELQGVMGGYYAREEGLADDIAQAIADHYRPAGPSDRIPQTLLSSTTALADKLDTLAGFFAAGIKPTGSGDPFALRRAALGIIRLILENSLRLDLQPMVLAAITGFGTRFSGVDNAAVTEEVLAFIQDRLEVQQREAGTRHDLIRAVASQGGRGDLVRLVARVRALQELLGSEDGQNLLTAYRRGANILQIESKKDDVDYAREVAVDHALLAEPAERELAQALDRQTPEVNARLEQEDFVGAMRQLALLRPPVDAFFDAVMVNAQEPDLRRNRLHLLARLRQDFQFIADFAVIED